MANDEELIQRLRDNKDIKPDDLKMNTQNIQMLNEGIECLTFEISQKINNDND
ncbi:MAG: hypothetical protein IJ300_03560 [Clostridia bacterium]|nr:hypothetical protein [Clostridia bacterium]